jgi:hypothetical protein
MIYNIANSLHLNPEALSVISSEVEKSPLDKVCYISEKISIPLSAPVEMT